MYLPPFFFFLNFLSNVKSKTQECDDKRIKSRSGYSKGNKNDAYEFTSSIIRAKKGH